MGKPILTTNVGDAADLVKRYKNWVWNCAGWNICCQYAETIIWFLKNICYNIHDKQIRYGNMLTLAR
jgi:hypothetical protein